MQGVWAGVEARRDAPMRAEGRSGRGRSLKDEGRGRWAGATGCSGSAVA